MRDEFMIMRQGKQYVLFAGLLDEAHRAGLKGIDTELLQVPNPENGNTAIVKATVEMEDPGNPGGPTRTFGGIGDASPDNVGRNIAPHVIRMAETRAKARALRDAVNVGATALEELGAEAGDEGSSPASFPRTAPSRAPERTSVASTAAPARVRAVPDDGGARTNGKAGARTTEADAAGGASSSEQSPSGGEGDGAARDRSGAGARARKSQIALLRTLAEELRGENGVPRLEKTIGKSLNELTKTEADEWIDRLTPAEGRE